MSKPRYLAPQSTRRSPAGPRRLFLGIDAGALMMPASYPYPPGLRPIAPYEGRVILPGRARQNAQLTPPWGGIVQRMLAHVDYPGRSLDVRSATRDAAGIRSSAKITRTRPWLFSGGSSAAPGSSTATGSTGSGCVGCK